MISVATDRLKAASRKYLRPMMRDLVSSALWRTGVSAPHRRGMDELVVVTFHRVLTDSQLDEYPIPGIALTCDEFSWFLQFFKKHYECGPLLSTLARFRGGQPSEKPLLAITFDDGQLDNYDNALPLLDKHGIRATFYPTVLGTISGCTLWPDEAAYAMKALQSQQPAAALKFQAELGLSSTVSLAPNDSVEALKKLGAAARSAFIDRMQQVLGSQGKPDWDGMMDSRQLTALAEGGHEIGSHSHSHAILVHCDEKELQREVFDSREQLEALTGQPIESFCYPNGDHDDKVISVAQAAGYQAAVTTKFGRNGRDQDLFRLLRCDIQGETSRAYGGRLSPARLALRLSGLQPGL